MLNKLRMAILSVIVLAGLPLTAMAQDASGGVAYAGSDPRLADATLQSADLSYQPGAYFYGNDCGGNSSMGAAKTAPRRGAPSGIILGGAMGSAIAHDMNCDDRRQAMSIYRDSLEGRIGQQYDWRNSEGGDSGSITPVRQYVSGGYACRDFKVITSSNLQSASRNGTACRQADGNWHTQ